VIQAIQNIGRGTPTGAPASSPRTPTPESVQREQQPQTARKPEASKDIAQSRPPAPTLAQSQYRVVGVGTQDTENDYLINPAAWRLRQAVDPKAQQVSQLWQHMPGIVKGAISVTDSVKAAIDFLLAKDVGLSSGEIALIIGTPTGDPGPFQGQSGKQSPRPPRRFQVWEDKDVSVPLKDEKKDIERIKWKLRGFGIAISGDNWKDFQLRAIEDAVDHASDRLHNLGMSIYGDAVQNVYKGSLFKQMFGSITMEKGKLSNDTWLAENTGDAIKFSEAAFFEGEKDIKDTNQAADARFHVSFTTEFLILHEISHQRVSSMWPATAPWGIGNRYGALLDSLRPVVQKTYGVKLPRGENSDFILASAGYKYGARTESNNEEYAADAIANWLVDGFQDNPTGELRRQLMTGFMSKTMYKLFERVPSDMDLPPKDRSSDGNLGRWLP
jgi:hypothetical protein